MRPLALVTLALVALAPAALAVQRPDSLAAEVRQYTVVDTAVVALTHVLLVGGTGAGGAGPAWRAQHGPERFDGHPGAGGDARPPVLYRRGRSGRADVIYGTEIVSRLGCDDHPYRRESRALRRDTISVPYMTS